MIIRAEVSRLARPVMVAVAIVSGATGCQTNPVFWTDGTKVDVFSDGSFVVSLASEKVASLGGPTSQSAQEFVLASLKAKGCVPAAPIGNGGYAWGGYWYAGGECK